MFAQKPPHQCRGHQPGTAVQVSLRNSTVRVSGLRLPTRIRGFLIYQCGPQRVTLSFLRCLQTQEWGLPQPRRSHALLSSPTTHSQPWVVYRLPQHVLRRWEACLLPSAVPNFQCEHMDLSMSWSRVWAPPAFPLRWDWAVWVAFWIMTGKLKLQARESGWIQGQVNKLEWDEQR